MKKNPCERVMKLEDESLRDDSHLQVNDGVVVVGAGGGGSTVLEVNTKHAVKLDSDGDEGDGREGEVQTIGDGVGKDLGQVPAIGLHRRQDTVDGKRHDRTVVQQGDD